MRVPDEKNLYNNVENVEEIIVEINDIHQQKDVYLSLKNKYDLNNPKEKDKFIKYIERNLIRPSIEYRNFIGYLRNNLNITKCTFVKEVDTSQLKKVTLEFHHYPLTLYNIVECVLDTLIDKHPGEFINPYDVAELVMIEHYNFNIGLVPLSKTVHELYHSGKKFINLKYVYGQYERFMKGKYMNAVLNNDLPAQLDSLKALSEKDDNGQLKEDILDTILTKVVIDGVEKHKIISSSDIKIS